MKSQRIKDGGESKGVNLVPVQAENEKTGVGKTPAREEGPRVVFPVTPTGTPSAREVAEGIIKEIEANPTLAGCKSFSELHDHCDANMLGDSEHLVGLVGFEAAVEILNRAQTIVDAHLAKNAMSPHVAAEAAAHVVAKAHRTGAYEVLYKTHGASLSGFPGLNNYLAEAALDLARVFSQAVQANLDVEDSWLDVVTDYTKRLAFEAGEPREALLSSPAERQEAVRQSIQDVCENHAKANSSLRARPSEGGNEEGVKV